MMRKLHMMKLHRRLLVYITASDMDLDRNPESDHGSFIHCIHGRSLHGFFDTCIVCLAA
jgi:hypothetical protein